MLDEATDSVSSIHVAGHEIVTGSVDGRVRIYDLRMGMVYVDVVGRKWSEFSARYQITDGPRTDQLHTADS